MLWLAIFLGVGLGLGCLFLLRWAWRGRRVDDHPLCRRCGFDLTGRVKGPERCSECGADLIERGSIVVGRRERRWGWVGAALLVLLLEVGFGVTAGVVTIRQVDLTPWKPTSWLVGDVSSAQPMTQNAAWAELNRRIIAPGARVPEFVAAVDRMLAIQADPKAKWDARMGDFIEALKAAGLVDEERYLRYVKQIPQYSVFCRQTVQRGEGVAYRVERTIRRGSRNRWFAKERTELLVNGVIAPPLVFVPYGSPLDVDAVGTRSGVFKTKDDPFKDLQDGEQQVTIRLTHEIFETNANTGRPRGNSVVVSVEDKPATIRLVQPGVDRAEAIQALGLEEAMRAAFGPFGMLREPSGKRLIVRFKVSTLPADCAYDVLMILPEREVKLGDLTLPKGRVGVTSFYTFTTDRPLDLPDAVELYFRPNPDLLRRTVDLHQYADVELRYPGVPTSRPSR